MSDKDAVYHRQEPVGSIRPLILSSPHSGTAIPGKIQVDLHERFRSQPPDTDWYIDRLYGFAPSIGASLFAAKYSRYVIDLNRDPQGQALYRDQRIETGLVPTHSFSGDPLYQCGKNPGPQEIAQRLSTYYWPYYHALKAAIEERRRHFAAVIFFDCHSINRHVPTIRQEPFPDFIIGTQDGRTAHPKLCQAAQASLVRHGIFDVAYNDPFKGGHLTRWFGKPSDGVHGLQLEMSQDLYLADGTTNVDPVKWDRLQQVLTALLSDLLLALEEINEGP